MEKNYLALLQKVLTEGEFRGNERTGTGTYAIFGERLEFDLRQGLPMLTTKKIHFKSVIGELLWFLSGNTNKHVLKSKYNVSIWDEWGNDETGELGKVYGAQWVGFGDWSTFDLKKKPEIIRDESEDLPWKGMVYDEAQFAAPILIPSGNDKSGRPLVKVEFLRSGTSRIVRKNHALKKVRDVWEPSFHEIGYLGDYVESPNRTKLMGTWSSMLDRCYNPRCNIFKNYGAKGVKVCKKWHCFEAFLIDAQRLPFYHSKANNWNKYEIDKDHFGDGFLYSPSSCAWLPSRINQAYAGTRPFLAKSPDGEEFYHISVQAFSLANKLNPHCVSRCLRGERPHHRKWKFESTEDRGLHFSSPVNQIDELVKGLINNPQSRRHLVSAWDASKIHEMALPPCHYAFQCFVHNDGYLDLSFHMRSVDLFLGAPFNILSYSLLCHILAKRCGLKAGRVIANFGDTHIYSNHIEQVKLQLSREPYSLPQLKISDRLNPADEYDISEHTMDDFEIIGYKAHPKISAPVAV